MFFCGMSAYHEICCPVESFHQYHQEINMSDPIVQDRCTMKSLETCSHRRFHLDLVDCWSIYHLFKHSLSLIPFISWSPLLDNLIFRWPIFETCAGNRWQTLANSGTPNMIGLNRTASDFLCKIDCNLPRMIILISLSPKSAQSQASLDHS